jgi:hypothetical protein
VRTERIDFLEGKHPYTRRFAESVARNCEDAAVSRVAAKWDLSVQTVRRIDELWSPGAGAVAAALFVRWV